MDSLLLYLLLDIIVVVSVILVMFRRMAFWHPLTAYLLFHLYSFSYRAFKIYAGAPLMYEGQANAEAITIDEINRALLWADVGLIVFVLASLWAHLNFEAKAERPTIRRVMNPNIARTIGILCLPIGAYFLYGIKSATLDVSVDAASAGYVQVISMWPIGALGLLVFAFGFRWYLVGLIAFFLGVVALQGYHRFMLILPLLFFAAYYLQTVRRRWPTWPIVVGAILVALIFPRLKYIGASVQYGDYENALTLVKESFVSDKNEFAPGPSEDFLDQYAGALSLIDTNDRKFWGSTYLAIVTLPIPRAWWPNKPGLADHLQEISTSGRNYAVEGRITTYLGESYLNFGYAGLFFIPALMGYLLTAYCLHAATGPMQRLSRYIYLVAFMALVQTFRDGLLSIFVFTFVHNMPMLFALVTHLIPGFAAKSLDRPAADPLAGEEEEEIEAEEARRLGGPEGQNYR
ncbi:MAG: O-antigen ligase [Verrucomicrobia bacterium]|nr:O-antigen ligase [Verrucomicrobiota bacterium]